MTKYRYLLLIFLFSCNPEPNQEKANSLLFTKLSPKQTGIHFKNELQLTEDLNVFRFRNYYNGGGVGIGDFNNDGLPDIFLTANMGENKLFLNKGNLQFEDITTTAGVGGTKQWSTGVSIADVNGDGLLDIYICNSGDIKGGKRENELFINNGDLTFTESAAKYGLDDIGFSTHAVFFDYDQDGDLDCYILNNSFRPVSSLGYDNIRHIRDKTGGDKLYRNDNGKFVDVSEEAGIYGSVIGFGLGVTITDVNQDGWMDLYVSNDFFERDYLYINQQDGTFKEELTERLGHISQFSMGTDAADVNNDGFPDIFVTDMLPKSEQRLKTMVHYDSYDVHQIKLSNDYYEQNMRNTLQLNRGNGTFQEIGNYAGVSATDWSWGAIIADFDNDGSKEIFITNGIYKDLLDQDFISFLANDINMLAALKSEKLDFQKLVVNMSSTKLSNYLFKKSENLKFDNISHEWGLDEPSFSNGAAYVDLDNDGDLDLIVNNVNQELFIYRNNSESFNKNNYLKLSFSGPDKNTFGVGTNVRAYCKGIVVMQENIPTKGFQSSMDYTMNLGLGSNTLVDSLIINWGYDKIQKIMNVEANQHLKLNIEDAKPAVFSKPASKNILFSKKENLLSPPFKHQENSFIDFDRESLIYHKLSQEGPALAVGDVNGDGLDDFYIGGASGSAGKLYIQDKNGIFNAFVQDAFEKDKIHEDVDAVFFDANGNGKLDLYVVSGGYNFNEHSKEYQDRLYTLKFDDKNLPVYERNFDGLPRMTNMGSCVKVGDFNKDGHPDLFVGSLAVPGKYGLSPSSHILQNDGKGKFVDVTGKVAPQMSKLGMVTDAVWVDYDNDDDMDLVVVGNWMPIVIFKNNGANLERLNNVPGLEKSEGWWKTIEAIDLNNDGNMDFIVGNWGINSRFKTSKEEPLTLFVKDFDNNGSLDHIFASYENGKLFPMALRHELINQLPDLKKQFVLYKDYAGKTVEDIFSANQLSKSIINKVHILESSIVMNNGDGSYIVKNLPENVQFSPVFSININEFMEGAGDGILLGGNFSGTRPEEGRYDANQGILLQIIQEGNQLQELRNTGLHFTGDVKKISTLASVGKKLLIVAKNNDEIEIYEY